MIRQQFSIEHYYKVIVYYNLHYDLFDTINEELKRHGASSDTISHLFAMMYTGKAKAVTYSNIEEHLSIVLFNYHETKEDYLNSIVHEAEHVKQAMLRSYEVEDKGEPPAYTIGYLVMKMYGAFKELICDCN